MFNEQVVAPQTNRHGVIEPALGFERFCCKPDYEWEICRPLPQQHDYAEILNRYPKHYDLDGIDPDIFRAKIQRATNHIKARQSKKNNKGDLLRGAHFPIVIPRLPEGRQLGRAIQELADVAGQNFTVRFPHKKFTNRLNRTRQESHDQPWPVNGTGYRQLLEKLSHQAVAALLFPTAFWGWSVQGQWEAVKSFGSANFVLAGPIDLLIALTVYPEICSDAFVPEFLLSGMYLGSLESVLSLSSEPAHLVLGQTTRIQEINPRKAGGLLYICS